MLKNLSIIPWSVTLKTSALYLKLCTKSSRCSTDLGYIWCPFPCLQTKKYLHKPETQYRIASITNFQNVNFTFWKFVTNNAQKHSKCLLSKEHSIFRILSDQLHLRKLLVFIARNLSGFILIPLFLDISAAGRNKPAWAWPEWKQSWSGKLEWESIWGCEWKGRRTLLK